MKNVLTVDVEDWYQTHDFSFPYDKWYKYEDRIEIGLHKILSLLDYYSVKATFFVLGCIAEKKPALIKKISGAGHEIGSHGMKHEMVTRQTREEFRESLIISKTILEDIIGKEVNMFRAPSWSINKETLWALEILDEEGFMCDSSIQPFRTPLSGFAGAPIESFRPIINNRKLNIVEFPSTTLQYGKVFLPFAGGLYLRILPEYIILWAAKELNKKNRTGMFYVHPWELDVKQPKIKSSILVRFAHYYNLQTTEKKIEKILANFHFVSMQEYVKDNQFAHYELD